MFFLLLFVFVVDAFLGSVWKSFLVGCLFVLFLQAGIICTLNARLFELVDFYFSLLSEPSLFRTSILASANPVESRYNARLSVVENIQVGVVCFFFG